MTDDLLTFFVKVLIPSLSENIFLFLKMMSLFMHKITLLGWFYNICRYKMYYLVGIFE